MNSNNVNKFSEKTVYKYQRTLLALASLLIVFWAFPVHADEIVYFEDFEDSTFSNCTNFNTGITSGNSYSGSKKLDLDGLESINSGDCNANFIASSTGIHTYTFYHRYDDSTTKRYNFESSTGGVFSVCFQATDEEVRLAPYLGCSGGSAVVIGSGSYSEYVKVQIVQNGDSIVARLNDTGMWYNVLSTTGETAIRLNISGSGSAFMDDLSIYAGDSNDSQNQSSVCSTCTRVISTDPSTGEYVATTTTGYMVSADYFVANGLQTGSSENDFCSGLSFLRVCTTKIQINVKRADSTQVYIYAEEVPDDGQQYIQHFFSEINSAGTYWLEIRIYNEFIGNNYLPSEDVLYYISKFYIGTPTSQAALDSFWGTTELTERNEFIEEGSIDPGDLTSPGLIPRLFSKTFDDFVHLPPWGYAVVFNDTLQNGTSTALGTLTMSFPTSSVAHGKTLELPLTTGFSGAITQINANGVTTSHGNQFETFLYYWNMIWYIMFAIWIAREVMGAFSNVDLSSNDLDLSKSKLDSSGRRVDNKRGTLDLRK